MSKKDLHIVSVPDLPPKRASRVLALKEAPPIPARCEYGLYLAADNANEADLSRKVFCVQKCMRHHARESVEIHVPGASMLTANTRTHIHVHVLANRWKWAC